MRKIIALSKNKNECFGDKALGLMELDNLHINVPEAIVIPSSFFFVEQKIKKAKKSFCQKVYLMSV